MTRELLLMRHGKSDWNSGLPDFERPLKERGRRGAQQLGNWLLERGLRPDLILSSDAERARGTILEACHTMGLSLACVRWEPRVYSAGLKQLLAGARRAGRRAQRDAGGAGGAIGGTCAGASGGA